MAPCLLGYGVIAKQLHADKRSKREGNTYWTWIQNYVANDYVSAVKTGSGEWNKSPNGDVDDAEGLIRDKRAPREACGAPKPITDRSVGQNLYSRYKGTSINTVLLSAQ